jgi:hypothetical protein
VDKDFAELRKEHLRVLHRGEKARIVELKEIREGLSILKRRTT